MRWWLRQGGQVSGPHEEEELRRKIAVNSVNSMDEVSSDGTVWRRVRQTSLWQPLPTPMRPPPQAPFSGVAGAAPRLKGGGTGGEAGDGDWGIGAGGWHAGGGGGGGEGLPSWFRADAGGDGTRPVGFLEAWKRGWTWWSWAERASRSEFWWRQLSGLLETFALLFLDGLLFGNPMSSPLLALYQLVQFVPRTGVMVRRLHDIGKSGWWVWVALIPVVGAIWLLVLLCQPGDASDNAYGPVPLARVRHRGDGGNGGVGNGGGGPRGGGYSFASLPLANHWMKRGFGQSGLRERTAWA